MRENDFNPPPFSWSGSVPVACSGCRTPPRQPDRPQLLPERSAWTHPRLGRWSLPQPPSDKTQRNRTPPSDFTWTKPPLDPKRQPQTVLGKDSSVRLSAREDRLTKGRGGGSVPDWPFSDQCLVPISPAPLDLWEADDTARYARS